MTSIIRYSPAVTPAKEANDTLQMLLIVRSFHRIVNDRSLFVDVSASLSRYALPLALLIEEADVDPSVWAISTRIFFADDVRFGDGDAVARRLCNRQFVLAGRTNCP
jgi:hypothetical protein